MVKIKGIKLFLFLITLIVLNSPVTDGQIYALIGNILTGLINLTGIQPFLFPLYPDKQLEILFHQNWDFIIIGSSPSGIALANRLTENPDVSVLLLEAGEEASIITDIPIAVGVFGSSQYDYGYTTEPQTGFCRACTNNKLKWERGKALGGSTIINYMLYVRGNRADYNRWSDTNNSGWSYDELLPYLKKIEDTHVNISDADYRGVGGYLYVGDVPWRTKLSGIYIKAAQESGLDYVDYNGRQQIGVDSYSSPIAKGNSLEFEQHKFTQYQYKPRV